MNNREHALLFSLGSMSVGQNLNTQHQLTEKRAVELNNYLAKIHIQGAAELNIATLNNEAGSTIHAEQQLTLNSDNIQGPGSISSAADIQVTLNGDQPKKLMGPLQAQGNLSLTAPGELNNYNRWEAGKELTVRCQFLRNHAEGSIRSEGHTQIVVGADEGGRLNNRGLIDGVTTEIRGHSLNNLGSGVIYGNHLLFGAETLNNNREGVNGQTKALIIGRQSLKIGAQRVYNREGALIMSAGDMAVGACLDEQQQLIGQMLSLDNHSATIEVQGDAHFQLRRLHNLDLHFGVEYRYTSEPVVEYEGDFRSTSLEVGNLGW